MHETEATMMTSRLSSCAAVAECLSLSICRRNVSLRLIIIVVRHEVLYCVVREELLELAVELCRESLVV